MKILIAVPTFGKVSALWAQNFYSIQSPLGVVSGHHFDATPGVDIAEKRNRACQAAVDGGYDVLIFVGDDVWVPVETVHKMLQRWREGAKAVTGVYWTKSIQAEPYIFRGYMEGAFFDWKCGDYFPIDWAGCDCLMLDVATLRKFERPWFSRDYEISPLGLDGNYTSARSSAVRDSLNTEDLYFYAKMKELGIQLMCDSAIQCWHEDRNTGVLYGLTPGMPQSRVGGPEVQGMLIADIGCGNVPNPLSQENTVHRFDADEGCHPEYLCDVRNLPVADETYDLAQANHVLEHLKFDDVIPALQEWIRVVKVGGQLSVRVPNLAYAAQKLVNDEPLTNDPRFHHAYELLMIYGSQDAQGMFHQSGFTRNVLETYATIALGDTCDVSVSAVIGAGEVGIPQELTLVAVKKRPASQPKVLVESYKQEKSK